MRSIFIGLAVFWFCVFSVKAEPVSTNRPILTKLIELRQLSANEATNRYAIRGRGIVTHARQVYFVQDETSGCYLSSFLMPITLAEGDLIEFEGVTGPGAFNPIMERVKARVISSKNPMPPPRQVSLIQLNSGMEDGIWTSVEGLVHNITERADSWEMELVSHGVPALVNIIKTPDSSFVADLLGCEIEIQGVTLVISRRNHPLSIKLACPNARFIKKLSSKYSQNLDITPLDFKALQKQIQSVQTPFRISLLGLVTENSYPTNFTLLHGLHRVVVEKNTLGNRRPRIGNWVNAYGSPLILNGECHLRDATFHEIGILNNHDEFNPLSPSEENFIKTLTSISEIRELSFEELSNEYPVRISGVVTLVNSNQWLFFVQDYTGGIYVANTNWPEGPFKTGSRVEVKGCANKGILSPIITNPKITYLGDGPSPTANRTTIHAIQNSHYDSQWVTVTGLVHSVEVYETNHAKLELSDARRILSVHIFNAYDISQIETYPGKRVQISGVCGAVTDNLGDFLYNRLILPGQNYIKPITTLQDNAFTQNFTSIENASELALSGVTKEVHIQGAVIGDWLEKNRHRIFIQGTNASISLMTTNRRPVNLGEILDVTGFSDLQNGQPIIGHAQIRPIRTSDVPQPVVLNSFKEITSNAIPPTLVQLQATLLLSRPKGDDLCLIFQMNDELFEARIHRFTDANPNLVPGGVFQITGILLGVGNSIEFLNHCILLVRSPKDLVLIAPPTWWTPTRIVLITSTVALLSLSVTLWVMVLRRKVNEQTEIIRKEWENEAALERRYHMVWDICSDGMCMCDSQGTLIQVNNAFCKMVGKKQSELIGHNFSVVHHPEKQEFMRNLFLRDFQSKEILRQAVQEWVLWNGRNGSFEISSSLLEEPNSPPMLLSLIREITERKHLEEQLRSSQKMDAIGRLAGGVAHDFNNILTVIQGYVTMLKEDDRIPEDARESLDEVEKSALRAADLTRQLLAFSRRQPLAAQSVDLSELVRNMMRLLTRLLGEDIKIDFHPNPIQSLVRVDVGMMEQVLMNLTVNARDAMPKGGILNITVEEITFTPSEAEGNNDRRSGDFVCLCVQDTGCGMDESILARIFEPFFTTKDVGKGTGLGLSTVYGIVKQHSGWIEVTSVVGKGTSFRVYIPVHEKNRAESHFAFPRPDAKSNGLILIVEDEPTVRQFVSYFLQRQGYTVLVASKGSEALTIWNEKAENIDLVLTDLIMPGSPNGRELGQRFEKEYPNIPIIYASGHAYDSLPEKNGFVEGYNYLQKPFDSIQLAKLINERIGESKRIKQSLTLVAQNQPQSESK